MGVTVTVYVAACPEDTVRSVGVTASEKSCKKTDITTLADWVPLFPETVMFMGLGVVAERLLTVNVLLWPPVIEVGLKAQVAPEEQERVIEFVNELGAEAKIVKVTEVVPITTFVDRALVEREKTALPIPERDTVCVPPVASSVMERAPVREPLDVGVNWTVNVQLSPTLRTVGKVVPQLLVSVKSPVILSELSVTDTVPVLVR